MSEEEGMSWHVDSEMQAANHVWPASLRASVHASRDYKEEERIANNDKVRLLPLVRLATGSISPHNPPVQETSSVNGEQESLAHQDSCPSRATGCIHLDSGRGDDSDGSF